MKLWLAAGVAAAVLLSGCGNSAAAPTTESASSSASSTATSGSPSATKLVPTDLPERAPKAPRKQGLSDASAGDFSAYFVKTFYYALATRDASALDKPIAKRAGCKGCRDTRKAIRKLKRDGQFQIPGKVSFSSVKVTGRQDDKRIVVAKFTLADGQYFNEATGATGRLAGEQGVTFQTLLSWDPKAKEWHVQDYAIDDGRTK